MRPSPIRNLPLTRGMDRTDREKIDTACIYAQRYLAIIPRRSGESYAEHGIEVAETLRELSEDASLFAASVLHDLLIHPDGEDLLNASPLTDDERALVLRMHPLRRLHIDANTEDLDRVIEAFTDDARLLPLRMAHRLNDVRHLDRFPMQLQKQIANEALHMYTAIAGRLGMHKWRHEMEDICFRLLHPQAARSVEDQLSAHRKIDTACLTHTQEFLEKKFREAGIDSTIDYRIKSLYSTYRKMIIKQRSFGELTDRLALRIIVPKMEDCYRALGVVHSAMHPIPGKLKDYIGAPKENGYRSIHTVVYPLPGVTEQPIEIQMRTQEMHDECEYGIAKHTDYKNYVYALSAQTSRVNLFRNLQSLRQEAKSPQQFEAALRTYFQEDHLALFDAQSNLYHLKQPVHAIDFVCHVHGRRSRSLKHVRVNGRERPIDTLLRDGDTIEAVFGKNHNAKKEWIYACKHSASKKLLRDILKQTVA